MKKNMSSFDRIVRVILAMLFVGLFFMGTVTGILIYVLLAVGAVFVLTSLMGSCPIYSLFGISTCPLPDKKV